jgi:general secretion pathway protein I
MVERMRQIPGFTLLEVLLAMAILASALTILMGTMANSNQQAVYANRTTRVSQLAKGKMIDLQYELMREGATENIESKSGTFSDEGFPDVEWEAEIQPIEIPEQVKEQLLGKVNAQLFGGEQSQGALKGNAAFSAKLPKLIGCIPQMINRIGTKVRRIVLVVRFEFQGEEQKLSLTQYVVDKSSREFNLFSAGGQQGGASSQGTTPGSQN